MNSRTLVKDSLEFRSPQRIPRQLWLLPWAWDHHPDQVAEIRQSFPDDIINADGFYQKYPTTQGAPYKMGVYVDEWGCIFENIQPGVIGEVKQPLLDDWAKLEHLRFPEEFLSVDIEQVNAFCRQTDLFVMAGTCPRPFERMQFMRKSDTLYLDFYNHPDMLRALLGKLHEFYIKELDIWTRTDVDAVSFMDDWGAQDRLLISPRMWREWFKPIYKDYIDLAHHRGKYAFMHSDGYTADIIPDLVELGLDALNTQIFCMDIETLGRRFAGKITFWGEIDRQALLSFGTPQQIDASVRRVYHSLYREGGVIAQCEYGAGAKPENVFQVFQSWEEVHPE